MVYIKRHADMAAILILPPGHPIMLIKMIYSFIVVIAELSLTIK